MAVFELSSEQYKNGRRPFVAILYELQPPDCVVDDIGTKYNKNGITFLEEYAINALESIKDMSVRVEFINEERTLISGHGDTGISDGLPVFENATVVGHCTEGYINDVVINGEIKRCVCAKGTLDEMCYPAFVKSLHEQLQNGGSIDGSIEIFKTKDNKEIIYKKGWLEKGRIPTEYIHSGWDMVVNPADPSSTLLELNNLKEKKEEQLNMDFDMNEVKSVIQSTISELNSKEKEFTVQISELNEQLSEKISVIANKDAKIVELNATVEQVQKALDDLKKEHETYWAERDALEKELGELKAKARIGELNTAISVFSDEERKFAEVEINSFNENPMNGDVDTIVSKIYASIGQVAKKAEELRISEQNSSQNNKVDVEDIFSEMSIENSGLNEDINIF